MSIQSETSITSFRRPLESNLHRFLCRSSLAWKCLCWEEWEIGLGLCKTCWVEQGESQLISWLGACTWSSAEAVILKLLLHKHNPYQSGLVAQESVTLLPLAEGSKERACRCMYLHTCIHTRVLYSLKIQKMKGKRHPTWRDRCQHSPCSAGPAVALLVTANPSKQMQFF